MTTEPLQSTNEDAPIRVSGVDATTLAAELTHLDPEQRAAQFAQWPRDQQSAVLQQLAPVYQSELLARLSPVENSSLIEAMDPDDRVRLLDELPADTAERLLSELSPREQELTGLLLGYPDESAGRIMSPEFLYLSEDLTVAEALAEVRNRGRFAETIYVLPVTDERLHLRGMVELKDLVLADPTTPVSAIMTSDVHAVHAEADQETVARLIHQAGLLAAPVVDADDRLIGLVTVDDAMDVLESEEGEDWARTGAAEPLGRPYFSVSVLRLARSRFIWLLLLTIAAALTVNVLSLFEDTLNAVVSLTLFIPLLIGIGGNTGSQSATTIVRAMAMDEIRTSDLLRVALREALVGLLMGNMVAFLAFWPVWLLAGRPMALIVSLTTVVICTLASLVGSMMPLLARRLGIDPAVVSAPVVTTVVDAGGLLVYLLTARAVLGI